jgi:hypothetical protein
LIGSVDESESGNTFAVETRTEVGERGWQRTSRVEAGVRNGRKNVSRMRTTSTLLNHLRILTFVSKAPDLEQNL